MSTCGPKKGFDQQFVLALDQFGPPELGGAKKCSINASQNRHWIIGNTCTKAALFCRRAFQVIPKWQKDRTASLTLTIFSTTPPLLSLGFFTVMSGSLQHWNVMDGIWFHVLVMRYEVKWCYLLSYNVKWCYVKWYSNLWSDVIRCDVMWYDITWSDVMWCGIMWCDVMWCVVNRHS